MINYKLEGEDFIPLCDLLKRVGVCRSGGEAKGVIADGIVLVDGDVELRKRCKIRKGQLVQIEDEKIAVS